MRGNRYRVEHDTRYLYAASVSQSWQLARLTPRELPWQQMHGCAIEIDPTPDERHESTDCFGNTITHFSVLRAHSSLGVRMSCDVEVGTRPDPARAAPWPWEAVREAVAFHRPPLDLMAARMSQPTPLLPLSETAHRYALASLSPGRDWFEALADLTSRIHADMQFDPDATSVGTSVDEVLARRRGVCQDFAQLMIACLRSVGLPARYMSGYLLTDPPPGLPRLVGVDASHAWVAAFAPGYGWVEFDPTNNQLADARYITLGWGADFGDAGPLRGVIVGNGQQDMRVSVTVRPISDALPRNESSNTAR